MELPVGFGKSLDVGTWSYGLLAAFIQGGSSAISAGIGVSVLDPKDWNLGVGKFYALMGTVFLISGGLKVATYLSGNPLPTVRTITTEVRSPHTTTVTTVQEGPINGKPKA